MEETIVLNIIYPAPFQVSFTVTPPAAQSVVFNVAKGNTVPGGGTTGQVLAKASNNAFDAVWVDVVATTFAGLQGDVEDNDVLVEYIAAQVPNVDAYLIPFGDPVTGLMTTNPGFRMLYDFFGRPDLIIASDVTGYNVSIGHTAVHNYIQGSGLEEFFVACWDGNYISLTRRDETTYSASTGHVFATGGIERLRLSAVGEIIIPVNSGGEIQFTGVGVANINHTTPGQDMALGTNGGSFNIMSGSNYSAQFFGNGNIIFGAGHQGVVTLGELSASQYLTLYAGGSGTTPYITFTSEAISGTHSGKVEFYTSGYGDGDLALSLVGRKVIANKLSVSNIQLGNAGLTAGDVYKDTAANIAANGDLILGIKT